MWAKAPFLLFRFPAALAAIVGAAVVLGAAAASRELFLASVGTAAFESEVAGTAPSAAGLTVTSAGPLAGDRIDYRDRVLEQATEDIPGLRSTIRTVVATSPVELFDPDRPAIDIGVTPAARTGFESHVERLVPGSGIGWWIAETTSERLGAGVGDEVGVRLPGGSMMIRVAGVYEDLGHAPPSDYWAPLARFIYGPPGADTFPPPFLLGTQDQVLDLLADTAPDAHLQWEMPVDASGLSLPEAGRIAARLERVEARMEDPTYMLGAGFSGHSSQLEGVVAAATETVAGLRGAVEAIALAGLGVALALFGAAGSYGVAQRRVEYAALSARGVGSLTLGARAALETAIPAVLGIAAGWALALALTRVSGPGDVLAEEAVRASVRDAALVLLVAITLLVVVAAATVRTLLGAGRGRLRRAARTIPWELGVLALAGAALYEILSRGTVPVGASDEPPRVDVLIPLFPILFVAGLGGLLARGLRPLLGRLRSAHPRGTPTYLAGRRLGAVPRSTLLLVTISALALGIIVYAGVFVSSARATAVRKAGVYVGSQSSITVPGPFLPESVTRSTTTVARMPSATLPGFTLSVLAIDPETFARVAYFEESFADVSLEDLVSRLDDPTSDRLPILVAGGAIPSEPTFLLFGREVPAIVVGTADAFPGMSSRYPLMVASAAALEESLEGRLVDFQPVFQVWSDGPPEPVLEALGEAEIFPSGTTTIAAIQESPRFLALSWIFGFLQALGILVGVIALAAVLLYVQSRQRAREVAYVLARSMGLSPGAHRRSVTMELGAMLGCAFAIGAVLATLAATLIHRKVDFLPGLPPSTVLAVPAVPFAAILGAVVVVAWVAAWGVQRTADRSNTSEVMRLAG